jgi:hypothetical protein
MVETITPVVHGGSRSRWGRFLVLHVAGATLAAAAFGLALGALGALLGAPWGRASAVVVAVLAAVYLAREAFGLAVPVPQLRRQVPDWWRTFFSFGPASFLYGFGLGVGFLTYLAHGTLVVVAAAAVATGRPLAGAAMLAPFGIARGLSAAVARRARTPAEGAALVGRLSRSAGWPGWRIAHAVALMGVLVAALVASKAALGPGDAGAAAAAVLAVAFGAAAVAKLVRPSSWRRALASYRLPAPVERVARPGVPVLEAAIAALPVLGLASTAGMVAAIALVAFSAAIVAGRLRVGRVLECGCYGTAATRDYRLLLARNAALLGVALAAWTRGVDEPAVALRPPSGGEWVPAALVVLGLAAASWVATRAVGAWRRGVQR